MAASSSALQAITIRAGGAIKARRCVAFDNQVCGTAGEKVLGVAPRNAASGELVAVETAGTTIVEAGAAIDRGEGLVTDSQGRAVPASALAIAAGATGVTSAAANGATALTGGETPQYVFADALEEAGAAGAFIEVKLR